MSHQLASPKALLIPGLAMCGHEYSGIKKYLTNAGFTVMSADNLCVGKGARPSTLSILSQAEAQWAEANQQFGVDSTDYHLFGLSMGGMIAATMAAIQPKRVRKLVVAASSPNIPEIAEAIPLTLADKWLNTKTQSDFEEAIDIAFGKTTLTSNRAVRNSYLSYRLAGTNRQSTRDFALQLSAIRNFDGNTIYQNLKDQAVETLVIAGEEDVLFPVSHSSAIQQLAGAKIVLMKNAGHMLHLEQPSQLAEASLAFFKS